MAYIRESCHCVRIQDLPEEILERIMSYLSPYSDCKNASLVSRKWRRLMQGVVKRRLQAFHLAARSGSLRWSHTEQQSANCVDGRLSHSACCVEGVMYMFGGMIPSARGSGSGTCFCDLRILDLGDRGWTRLMPTGEYPSPKAAASMVHHNGSLILFGGYAPPVPNPPHQPPTVFNDLHIYDIAKNHWKCVVTSTSPPPLANHGASMMGDLMIIFGGGSGSRHKGNDVWVFSLQSMVWSRMEIEGKKPHPRDKHVQVVEDDGHILIIGGLGNFDQELQDVWMLDISEVPWCWREVEVRKPEHAARNFIGHAACKIGECVVIFNSLRKSSKSVGSALSRMFTQNGNRQRGAYSSQSSQLSLHSTNQRGAVESGSLRDLHPEAKRLCSQSNDNVNQNSVVNDSNQPSMSDPNSESVQIGCPCSTECQCKTPVTYKLRARNRRTLSPTKLGLSPPLDSKIPYGEQQYVLDISKAVTDCQVEWLEIPDQNAGRSPINFNHPSLERRYGLAPEALYPSICVGRAEIIRFGGMLMDRRCPRALNDQYYAF
ncbi:F-box only protein 42-like [Patiria miniata]|uniref:F-box domain-containing protein n=1 Tax=Patiria miniata TaxID=46514 RepID=A0A914BSI8_PATMI|nr:F-box only protein 42-like [Patiria miniata]